MMTDMESAITHQITVHKKHVITWGRNDEFITAERSYKDIHVFGTRVERLIDGEWVPDR